MNRSHYKGPFLEKNVILLVNEKISTKKIFSRKSMVVPSLIGKILHVHNGKIFLKIKILDEMVGHKLGEFAPTRKKFTFKKKKKK